MVKNDRVSSVQSFVIERIATTKLPATAKQTDFSMWVWPEIHSAPPLYLYPFLSVKFEREVDTRLENATLPEFMVAVGI